MLLEVQAVDDAGTIFIATALAAAGRLSGDFTEADSGDGDFGAGCHAAEVEDYHHSLIGLVGGYGFILV